MKPQNFEESLIWYFIIGTYVIYAFGILLPVYSLLAWVLLLYVCKKILSQKIYVPGVTWVWCICMIITLVATYMGIEDFNLGTNYLIRGILGWGTSSAVIALFLLSGCLNIRPQLIYRAVCILCLQSLIVIPIGYLAYQAHLPSIIYSSPIERLIQNGPIFYNVGFYLLDEDSQGLRLALFAPWCPALGLVSNIYFFLALQESNRVWRCIGIVGALAMNVVSVSRAALVSLPLVLILIWLLKHLTRPSVQIAAGIISALLGIGSTPLLNTARDLEDLFYTSRASSSRVRAALTRIALERWQEAPLWGHGTQEPGPQVVARMPIGSHHTWVGLLFAKGIVGLLALVIPISLSFVYLLIKARQSVTAKVALSILLTLFFFSWGEQIDVLSYLYWPGLIVIGIAFQERQTNYIPIKEKPEPIYIPHQQKPEPIYIPIEEKPEPFFINKIKQKLSNQFIRNIGWLGGAELLNRVFRLGTTVILARSLTSQDYGLAAVVMTLNEFASVFTLRSGIGGKIVQASEEDLKVFCNTSYWLNWILCFSLFIIQCIAAFPIAWFYKDNRLIAPICVAALVYLMLPIFSIHNALIDRANRFKITAISNAIQSCLGNILTMLLALLGMGMWAIVLPIVLTTPVWIVVTHLKQPWRPSKSFTLERWQEIVNFGKDVLGYELLDKLRANLDYILIGRFLGVEALGVYFFAFNAGLGISLNVINVMVWPLYPHLCAARNNLNQLREKYFHSLKTIGSIIIPLVILQSSLAPFYVPIVFGKKWEVAIPIVVLVCLSALPRPFASAAALLLQSLDKAWINLRWSIIFTLIFTIALLVGMKWGTLGVATAVLVSHVVAMPVFTVWAIKYVFAKNSNLLFTHKKL